MLWFIFSFKVESYWFTCLYNSFCKTSHRFLHSNPKTRIKANKFNESIWMFSRRRILVFLRNLCSFPYFSCASCVAVNIQGKNISLTLSYSYLTAILSTMQNNFLIFSMQSKSPLLLKILIVFRDRSLVGILQHLINSNWIFKIIKSSNGAINSKISKFWWSSQFIEIVAYLSINSKAKIVTESLLDHLLR